MKLWIASVSGMAETEPVRLFRDLAAAAASSRHVLAASPDEADAVLFVDCHMFPHDPGLRVLGRNPLFGSSRERALVYDERSLPWLRWPGIYVSMPSGSLRHEFQEPWAYYRLPFAHVPAGVEPDLLFSFVGASSRKHRVRHDVLGLRDDRAIVEEVRDFVLYDDASPGFEEKKRYYAEVVDRSKFVLCPRGKATSSFRLYEAMSFGRVPVVLSDDWIAPAGPDWESCSIRWPEGDVGALPRVLREREHEFEELSAAARRTYEEWFAPEQSFRRIADLCERLLDRDAPARFPRGGIRRAAYLRAHADHARWCTRWKLIRAIRRVYPSAGRGR